MATTGEVGRWYVYHLVDPRDGQVFYVGMSTDPANRLRQHYADCRSDASERCREIKGAGLRAELVVIAGFWDKFAALDFEREQMMDIDGVGNFNAHPRPCICPRHHAMRLRKIAEAEALGHSRPWAWYELLDLRHQGLVP